MTDRLSQALRALPHGPEFRFIHRLLRLDEGQSGEAEYDVRPDEPFLKGHFPGNPLLPGVLLLEAAAQLAGIVAQSDPKAGVLPNLKLTGIRSVKILGSARPGQTVHLEALILGRLGNLVQAQVSAHLEGERILQAELTLGSSEGSA